MEQVCTVHKDNECGRSYRCLSHIVYLQASALVGGGLNSCGGIRKHIVEHTCGYSHAVLGIYAVYKLKQLIHTLTRFCGDEYERNI